ncbi:Ig-like domain-containing protein [Pseudenhygromyxa sp. WMMC2535]|uniref:Ig-like domain-containing protein n=1 Tax=Pseudenhygromyxa sp. WMMC2535 TaxID=2712867 RepID=UPI00155391AC|nr:Ig-like domain-containing protein [Pseudenhygromyxa sp. WMMC2535]NVB41940.1 Ig-like domain-containing protein [Pseudenhygromyxa sp. WMMC2535]
MNNTSIISPTLFFALAASMAVAVAGCAGEGEFIGEETSEETGEDTGSEDVSLISLTINGSSERVVIDEAMVVSLQAEVSGAVERVDFFDLEDGTLLASDMESPYEAFWIADGEDDNGLRTFEAVVVGVEGSEDSGTVRAEIELPGAGDPRWTLDLPLLPKHSGLVTVPSGAIMFADEMLGAVDTDGGITWEVLPFEGQAIAFDGSSGEVLVMGADDGDLNFAGVSSSGELRWTSTLDAGWTVDLEGMVIRGRRMAVVATWGGNGNPVLFVIDRGDNGQVFEPLWFSDPGENGDEETTLGNIVFREDGSLLVPLFQDLGADGVSNKLLAYDEAGGMSTVYESTDLGLRLSTVAVADGQVFLGGEEDGKGVLMRLDADGEVLSSATVGDEVSGLRADRGGVVFAAPIIQPIGADLFAGRVDDLGELDWVNAFVDNEIEGEVVSAIDVNDLGYTYLLTLAGEGLRLRSIHP